MGNLTRRAFVKTAATGIAAAPFINVGEGRAQSPKNVLFIAIDDLRPELGCYGKSYIHSPNIDRLANRSLRFERSYCQQAVCNPSRNSLMSGLRPSTTGIFSNAHVLREVLPDVLTLPQHFKQNGYETISLGKIYHHRGSDDPQGWSQPEWRPRGAWRGRGYLSAEGKRKVDEREESDDPRKGGRGPAFERADVPDSAYPDGKVAEKAIEEMNRLKDESFFLAVGFVKPHLPFNAPGKYWDLYPKEEIELPAWRKPPIDAPDYAGTNWGELRNYVDMPRRGPLDDEMTRTLIRGYRACVSYTDALVGQVLGELDRLGKREDTVVILWGDHGWKLGEYNSWCKHTNYEIDAHAPMMLSVPGRTDRGRSTRALTEFVDIYPTLTDVCGLETPDHCEGISAAPLIEQPDRPWKRAAFNHFPRGSERMGSAMKTDRYRYVEWTNRKTGDVIDRELYDHATDPGETINIAVKPEHSELVKRMAGLLKAGWKEALPGA